MDKLFEPILYNIKSYYYIHRERKLKYQKEYNLMNFKKIKKYTRIYYLKNKYFKNLQF